MAAQADFTPSVDKAGWIPINSYAFAASMIQQQYLFTAVGHNTLSLMGFSR